MSKSDGASRPAGVGQSHSMFTPVSVQEATWREIERRRIEAQLPANIEYEQLQQEATEARRRAKLKGKPEGLIGPPNPYKPNRKG